MKGNATNSAYSASKGGVEAFTRTFALEIEELDVDVMINAVEPGGTDTPMWRRGKSAQYIQKMLASGRIRAPDYMTSALCYLVSPASKAINGCLIDRDFVPPAETIAGR